MKASFRWLRELLPGLPGDVEEVSKRLMFSGLEVEASDQFGEGVEPVMVAEVQAIEPHPKRDGLRLVTVGLGAGRSQRVVCGAPNVPAPGGLVLLAPLGTRLPAAGMTIEPRAIGGVVSEGMLCSDAELGIGPGGEGIVVLAKGTPGRLLVDEVPSARDVVLSLNVTPNRPDALGHVGIARDLSVLFGLPFAPPSAEPLADGGDVPPIVIEEPSRCPFYGAAVLSGVAGTRSDVALQHRLFSLGVRPVSGLVDVTNLMLLERAQPMHAFDLDKVVGRIVVRLAREGEVLETLDGKARKLTADDLVIADDQGPIALAGVMGGARTEIGPTTTRLLLECAYFEPRSVRRASRRHGLHTESSHRFERGIDRLGMRAALARAVSMVRELFPGAKVLGASHVEKVAFTPPEVSLRSSRLDALLGCSVPFGEAIDTLGKLGCEVLSRGEAEARFRVPSHRPDLTREADLIEEVMRIRGIDAIAPKPPAIVPQAPSAHADLMVKVREAAASLGLGEAVTYAFVSPRELAALRAPEAAVKLANPLTEERSVMRTSILPGLLEACARARRHGEKSVRLFTMGRVFFAADGGALPVEKRRLGVVMAGPRPGWLSKPEEHDVYDAKGVALEIVGRALGHEARVVRPEVMPAHLHPRGGALVLVGDVEVGSFGPLHPDVVDALELGGPAVVVDIDVDALERLGAAKIKARAVPKVPANARDIALEVHDDVPAGEVARLIGEVGGDLCEHVELFDVFRGDKVRADHRSLAFHVIYRDPQARASVEGARTLTDAEVDERHRKVEAAVRERLGAVLRA